MQKFDVIIIGAGIGGLVCSCYLAKAGMKVVVLEKNSKSGGCCCGFTVNGFSFDTGVFALGDCKEDGKLGRVIRDLSLNEKMTIKRLNPADMVLIPGHEISIGCGYKNLASELKRHFPGESVQLKAFLNFLNNSSISKLFVMLKNSSLKSLLDAYFKDEKLKLFFKTIMTTFGQSSYNTSAITAAVVLREFIIDGGYYPKGGIQSFPDSLVEVFKKNGGTIKFSNKVVRILCDEKKVKGVISEDGSLFEGKFIVSNCDISYTFSELLKESNINTACLSDIKNMIPSMSAFAIFLGLRVTIESLKYKCKYWCAFNNDLDEMITSLRNNDFGKFGEHMLFTFPSAYDIDLAPKGMSNICILVTAPFRNKIFWKRNKEKLCDIIIKKAEKTIPELQGHICVKNIATPLTYYRYTGNKFGAAYGWDCSLGQFTKKDYKGKDYFENLFFVGHWTNNGFGVSRVAFSGYHIAEEIVTNFYGR